MRAFKFDLHIHTALSPCADQDMTPYNIVQMARMEGITIIAAADHNTSGNARSLALAAPAGMTVLYGMEVQTREEVHLLTLFENWESVRLWEDWLTPHLPRRPHDPYLFGPQLLLGPDDQVLGEYPWLLHQSLSLPLSQIVDHCQSLGGLAIPAHIYRPTYSLFSQLGSVPQGLKPDACEVSSDDPRLDAVCLTNSDAHSLCDLVRSKREESWLFAHEPTFSELRLGLQRVGGRKVVIGPRCGN